MRLCTEACRYQWFAYCQKKRACSSWRAGPGRRDCKLRISRGVGIRGFLLHYCGFRHHRCCVHRRRLRRSYGLAPSNYDSVPNSCGSVQSKNGKALNSCAERNSCAAESTTVKDTCGATVRRSAAAKAASKSDSGCTKGGHCYNPNFVAAARRNVNFRGPGSNSSGWSSSAGFR